MLRKSYQVFSRKLNRSCMSQYVYTMNRVSKIVPPKRQIQEDISLSFPGAKIGVLKLNGCQIDTSRSWPASTRTLTVKPFPCLASGFRTPQEPQLDPNETVRQAVEGGMGEGSWPPSSGWKKFTPFTPSPMPTLMP